MARFKVGDYVKYSNKRHNFVEKTGTIIGTRVGDDYIIKLDAPYHHYMVNTKDMHVSGATFLAHEFMPPSFNYMRTITKDCIRIGRSSSGLSNGEKPYDPTQQGDLDDDI